MRAISLVNRLEFDFTGNVIRKGVTLGDVDNDGQNELIVGSENGEVAIFKGKERWQTINGLTFISCVAVGDVLNEHRNCLVIVTADGWCHIYASSILHSDASSSVYNDDDVEQVDGQVVSGETLDSTSSELSFNKISKKAPKKNVLKQIHIQRIPANAKDILLGDVDGDGLIEMVLGLTDRVVRSYRWYNNPTFTNKSFSHKSEQTTVYDKSSVLGKLLALNKWECANQIGSITLHHSFDEKPSLLIAQPGGTFMRICCQPEEPLSQSEYLDLSESSSESLPGSTIDYQFLGLSRMRNQNISTEILGDLKTDQVDFNLETSDKSSISNVSVKSDTDTKDSSKAKSANAKGKPYAVATLDGTIMLVQDEIILWAIAVDHQVFSLSKLDVTGNGVDDIVVCAWDGQTYILDQNKNTVRFQLEEAVQGFESGYYSINPEDQPVTCLVYVTFKNKILLYYDIPLKEMISKKFEPDLGRISDLLVSNKIIAEEDRAVLENLDRKKKTQLIEYLLYGVKN